MDVLAIGASVSILVTVLLFALAFYASASVGAQVRGRLQGVLAGSTSVVEGSAITPLREEGQTVVGLLRFAISGSWLQQMEHDLQRADSRLQPVDFIAIRVAFAGVGFVVPFVLIGGGIGVLVGLGAAVLAFQVPQFYMTQRRNGRRRKLEEQLPEALTLVANSLKAGFGLLQSLSQAADRLEHPISTELAQTIHEMNIGANADEALLSLSERSDSYDLDLVVTAMLIQRSVGGNLAEILDTVAAMMRERVRIRGEIITLTAQQRLTGIIIGLLPVGVGAMFLVVSPEYVSVLFTETIGRVMLGISIVLEAVGIMVIRRILAIEV